ATELGSDPRFATNRQRVELRNEVLPKIAAVMKTVPTDEWVKRLDDANVPHSVVRDYASIFAHEQTPARHMKLTRRAPKGNPVDLVGNPVHLTGGPLAQPTMPPRLGEQTDAVLRELGLSADEIAALRAKGVV